MASSGMLRLVAHVRTDVSEEPELVQVAYHCVPSIWNRGRTVGTGTGYRRDNTAVRVRVSVSPDPSLCSMRNAGYFPGSKTARA
jgi:hypothetical protein